MNNAFEIIKGIFIVLKYVKRNDYLKWQKKEHFLL